MVGGALVAGCRSDAVDLTRPESSPTTGTLGLVIEQLPAGAAPLLTITNAAGFRQSVTGPQVLPDLTPGDYTVVAADVIVGDSQYVPSPATQSITVVAGKPTAVSVAYAVRTLSGGLTVTATGLPAGANASITVTGPGGFAQSISGPQTLPGLKPGRYTIEAANVSDGTYTWAPVIAEQSISVPGGAIASANVAYAAADGALNLTITGVPGGSTGAVSVSGPGGFSRVTTASQTLGGLAPGDYSITATSVLSGSYMYSAVPATQTLAVVAGSTVTANVLYKVSDGSLAVAVSGVPSGASANIAVAGPGGYARALATSQVLTGLAPGSYSITAENFVSNNLNYAPGVSTQTKSVTAGSMATASVAYSSTAPTAGALAVTITGLPGAASVTVTGPSAFSQVLTATQTLSGLVPGSYTVTATAVTSSGTTYNPQPATQTLSVTGGATASAGVVYAAQTSGTLSPGYHARSMTVLNWTGKAVIFDYKIYVPTGYSPTKQWPVIVTAHGSGERSGDGVTNHSNNNTSQLGVGLGPHISALGERAIVVFPQMPLFDFGNAGTDQATVGAYFDRMMMTALNQTLAEVNADRKRIYATGNSAGGFVVWDLLYQNPTVFAAGIPAAAGITAAAMTQNNSITNGPAAAVARLATMPIWMFNADDDTTVPYVTYGLPIVTEWAAKGIGDPPFRHTLYSKIGGHQATWDTAFAAAATWNWLFAQHQ